MASFTQTIEDHPYLVVGGVLVGVLIIYFAFSGSSSSGGGTTYVQGGNRGNGAAMFAWANAQNARNAAVSMNLADNKTRRTLGLAGDKTIISVDKLKTKVDLLGIGDAYKLGNTKLADQQTLGLASLKEATTLADTHNALEEYLANLADKGYVQGGELGAAFGGGLSLYPSQAPAATGGYGGTTAVTNNHGWPGSALAGMGGTSGYGGQGIVGAIGGFISSIFGGASASGSIANNGATSGDSSGVAGDTGSGASPAAGAGGVGAA